MQQNSAEHCDHRVKPPTLSRYASRREIRALRHAERLHNLPARCELLLAGFDNADNDPSLVFAGLPYEGVMMAALRSPAVRAALALLDPADARWD